MRCQFCGYPESRVLESRVPQEGDSIRRRRECGSCGKRFTTFERAERPALYVVKRDGSRQLFDPAKPLNSMLLACRKRPVPGLDLEAAADRIERSFVQEGCPEIPSSAVGEQVLRELLVIDRVAYVRFASVYSEFETVEDFERLIADVDRRPGPAHSQPSLL